MAVLLSLLALVLPAASAVLPAHLPPATLGKNYSAGPLTINGGGACTQNFVAFEIAAGHLPPGVSLSRAGYFSGAPAESGAFSFLLRASNNCSATLQPYHLRVEGAPMLIVTPSQLEVEYLPGGPAPQPLHIRVASTHAGLPYRVQAPTWPWLSLRQRSGVTPSPDSAFDSDRVEVHLDAASLWPGHYEIPIRFSAWRSANRPVIHLRLLVHQPRLALHAMALPRTAPRIHIPPMPEWPERIWVPPPPPPPGSKPEAGPRSRFRYRPWIRSGPPPAANPPSQTKPTALGAPVATAAVKPATETKAPDTAPAKPGAGAKAK
ncbi:MAG: hypothetical protein FJW20_22395 [Acidimicrobiia bacterium]|nr:hypothetical protein [Acidimicrobiia bacterium]